MIGSRFKKTVLFSENSEIECRFEWKSGNVDFNRKCF